jgi:aspartate kinase
MTKPVVVQKYGGSSVADAARIENVARLVAAKRAQGFRVCVVVSAMGKTTDELLARARAIHESPPRRELDMLLSCGERASMALLAMALDKVGVPSISLTGSQSGIITNDSHSGARIVEVRPYRVQDELERDRVVIVAGFQGVSYKKEVTTLGRGGSDTTAVALAAALDAVACEIYSDVDGVWTADPRVVDDAVRIDALSFEEMQELAAAGAKVLNAQAVQFAKQKGIAIYAKQTGSPEPGTVVRKDAPPPIGTVRGVAHKKNFHVVASETLAHAPALFAHLDAHEIPSGSISGHALGDGPIGVVTLVPPEDAHGAEACFSTLPEGSKRLSDVGAVSLVGQGMLEDRSVVRDGLALLGTESVVVRGLSTSSFRVTFLVTPDDVERATRALHRRFLSESVPVPDPSV